MDSNEMRTKRISAEIPEPKFSGSSSRPPRHFGKRLTIVFVLIILFVTYFFGQQLSILMKAKGYQAVFLTNGQVYFGKLSGGYGWLKLSDIYYLQASNSLQQTGVGDVINPNQNIQLIKLGSELHGPADAMYLERDKVLFWENMKDSSPVVVKILESQGQK